MLNHKNISQCIQLSQISKRVQMGHVHISHDESPEKLVKSENLRKTEAVGDEEDVTVTQKFFSAYPFQGHRKGWNLPQL